MIFICPFSSCLSNPCSPISAWFNSVLQLLSHCLFVFSNRRLEVYLQRSLNAKYVNIYTHISKRRYIKYSSIAQHLQICRCRPCFCKQLLKAFSLTVPACGGGSLQKLEQNKGKKTIWKHLGNSFLPDTSTIVFIVLICLATDRFQLRSDSSAALSEPISDACLTKGASKLKATWTLFKVKS